MAIPMNNRISFNEYLKIKESSEELLEYIDGIVYMAPSPSTKHQRISARLQGELFSFLKGKECEVFSAPFDVLLKKEDIEGEKLVIPDLSVICDKEGFTDTKYIGVPTLIIEILSPSNQAHDLVRKLNIYMDYGVKEYWIVNPMLNTISLYKLNDEGLYEQVEVKAEKGIVKSHYLIGFQVDLEEVFI
jgi:Uma2 family endonuclease